MQANQTERDYAKEQAIAKVQSICELIAAYEMDWDRLEELKDEKEGHDDLTPWEVLNQEDAEELKELQQTAGDYTSQNDVLEAIQDHPLSIDYRSGWCTSGEDMTPEEFRVVLCTGGPHVEILGELDYKGRLDRVRVIYKDWGTSGELFDFDRAAVMAYCELIGVGSF